jgi:ribose 1,5-bisphosphokinase
MLPLVYIMGPSGAGKDTLIAYARARVDPARILFAHRYITRPATDCGENHIALSAEEFAARSAAGLFALSWRSHGFAYAIGAEIDLWRGNGILVVVSGARTAWPQARRRYPDIRGILVDAPVAVRAARLAARGREDEAAIAERLRSDVQVAESDAVQRLDNGGPLHRAGGEFIDLLDRASKQIP